MIQYFILFMLPFLICTTIGVIVGQVRKSWTPLIIGVAVGVILEGLYYVLILSQMVVQ